MLLVGTCVRISHVTQFYQNQFYWPNTNTDEEFDSISLNEHLGTYSSNYQHKLIGFSDTELQVHHVTKLFISPLYQFG